MMAIQYTLYEMTDPYVAELVQPRMALKIPHPPPPLSSGLPKLTCQTLWSISYDPAPAPTSAASPPTALFQFCAWKYQTALEKSPAATRYRRQVEMTRKN
jgi:hypothetical protein